MRIDLVQYMKNRYLERNVTAQCPGPVVTISREMGCPGKKVSQCLTDALNKRFQKCEPKDQWKWIGAEIFIEAAKELDLDPNEVKKVFNKGRSLVDQILSSQTHKFYKSDKQVLKTVGQVIRSMANDGHVIILGRGGIALTRDIPKSLHIFLEAPLEWRASLVSEKQQISFEEAKKYASEIDKRRTQHREYYQGKNTDYTWFDMRFNCMTLCVDEIVEGIIKMMEVRHLI